MTVGGQQGIGIRAIMPNATAIEALIDDGRTVPLVLEHQGLVNIFGIFIPGARVPLAAADSWRGS